MKVAEVRDAQDTHLAHSFEGVVQAPENVTLKIEVEGILRDIEEIEAYTVAVEGEADRYEIHLKG